MEYGFTYNGIHCKDMGCNYIPSATKRLVQPDYSVASSDVSGMDGGYCYGAYLKVRPFVQDCYFEDLTEEQLRKIYMWFDRRSAGELIFDARPHVKYMVRPTKAFEPELYEHVLESNDHPTYSGTFSMTLSAYDPYGYQTKTVFGVGEDLCGMDSYCGILCANQMPDSPAPDSKSFLVYNCGTEPCGLNLRLRGQAPSGVTLRNLTNGTKCQLTTLPAEPAIQSVDSDQCRIRYGYGDNVDAPLWNTFEDAFEYHYDGYISLEPGDVVRNITISFEEDSNLLKVVSGIEVTDSLIKKYLWAGAWVQIQDVLDGGILVTPITAGMTGTQDGLLIATLNEIEIVEEDVALTDIHVSCSPRVL